MKKLIIIIILTSYNLLALPCERVIAYYPFDGDAKDYSGNGFHGTEVNGPTYESGVQNEALKLVGKGYYINLNKNEPVNLIGSHVLLPKGLADTLTKLNKFKISIWVNEDEFSHEHGEAYYWFGTYEKGWLGMIHHEKFKTNERIEYAVGGISQNAIIGDFDKNKDFNRWINYRFEYESGWFRIYKDLVLVDSMKQTILIEDKGDNFAVGRHWWYYGGDYRTSARFTGKIDEMKIYIEEDLEPIITGPAYICPGEEIELTLDQDYSSYKWSTEATGKSIKVSTPGIYTCEVTNYLGCTEIAEFKLEEYQIDIQVTPSAIAFNKVEIGKPDTLKLIIKNNSNAPVQIKRISTNESSFKIEDVQLPLFLNVGGELTLDIEFTPLEVRDYQADLKVELEECSEEYSFTVHGEGYRKLELELILPDTVASVGDTICIPVYALMKDSSITGTINTTVKLPFDLIQPFSYYLIEDEQMKIDISYTGTIGVDTVQIAELCGFILLGAYRYNSLEFMNTEVDENDLIIKETNGSLTLRNICNPGLRPVESLNNLQVGVMPNPAKDYIHIEIYSEEDSKITIIIYDIEMKVLYRKEIESSGEDKIEVNLNDFPNGFYQVLVQTEWEQEVIHLIIEK